MTLLYNVKRKIRISSPPRCEVISLNRVLQGVGVAVQALWAAVIHAVGGDEARQGRVVVAGVVVEQAAAVAFFVGVSILRGRAGVAVCDFLPKGGVGQAADFDAAGIGQYRRAVQVVAVHPGEDAVLLLCHAQAIPLGQCQRTLT